MFLWNMIGALVLIPALARFLLPGAREGSTSEPTDTAVLATESASIASCRADKKDYERCSV
jgi:uncharacterized protein